MMGFLTAIIEGTAAFAATNIDDLFILMVFFAQINRDIRKQHIVVGQYLGFLAILALSVVGSFGLLLVAKEWIGLLGLIPMAIGIGKLVGWRKTGRQPQEVLRQTHRVSDTSPRAKVSSVFSPQTYAVAVVTFANGGDNVSIYVPLFASGNLARTGLIIVVFLVLVGVWCYIGFKLVRQPVLAGRLARYSHVVMPIVLIGLGFYILAESGAWRLFVGLFGI